MLTLVECTLVLRDEGRLSSEGEMAFAPSWMRVGWWWGCTGSCFAGENRDPRCECRNCWGTVALGWQVWRCMEGHSPDLHARHPWAVENIYLPEYWELSPQLPNSGFPTPLNCPKYQHGAEDGGLE